MIISLVLIRAVFRHMASLFADETILTLWNNGLFILENAKHRQEPSQKSLQEEYIQIIVPKQMNNTEDSNKQKKTWSFFTFEYKGRHEYGKEYIKKYLKL